MLFRSEIAKDLLEATSDDAVPHDLIPTNWPNDEALELSKLQLPVDVVVAKKTDEGFDDQSIKIEKVGSQKKLCNHDEVILDIGPATSYIYSQILKRAMVIFWNGPMGFVENFNFAQGTKDVAQAIADSKGFSVIGGGDTEGIVSKFGLEDKFGHVSTGGGAALALLAGEELAVLKYLQI